MIKLYLTLERTDLFNLKGIRIAKETLLIKETPIYTLEFFPLPFMIGALILVLVVNRFHGGDRAHQIGWALLVFYLLAVIGVVIFPIYLPENWPANLNWGDTIWSLKRINLTPFYYGAMTYETNRRTVILDIILNVLLTMPFGFGGCFLKFLRGKRLMLGALGAGLTLEGVQLLLILILGSYPHSVDINDVLFNALGVMVGGVLFRVAEGIFYRARGWLEN